MPSTAALIYLPAPGGNPSSLADTTTASPTATIITHISRTYRPKPLGSYALDHRLLVDTPSLLPGHSAPRRYIQFLSLPAHLPGKTSVGTSATGSTGQPNQSASGSAAPPTDLAGDLTLVTIPSQPDTLLPLLIQRMSPLWAPRQAHRVDGGASFAVDDWQLRIGELRISGGQGQGRVKGCICEVELLDDSDGEERSDEETERIVKSFFEGLVQGSGVDLGAWKVIVHTTGTAQKLVRQYMELLKFART